MEVWQNVASMQSFEDYLVRRGPVPIYDVDAAEMCLTRCRENLCGCYGTTWGCPPGMRIKAEDLYEATDYVLVLRRTFCLDVKDKELVEDTTLEMQHVVRMMVIELRKNGIEAMGFADGKCRYCGVCSYPEPCRFPEMIVPSVSSLGLDVGDYLKNLGDSLSFSDNCLTLYGFIFVYRARMNL